jgi:CheY-like chemotaxis protein
MLTLKSANVSGGLAVNSSATRVLVIDDQAHVRATISLALQAKGYQVVGAECGADGLKQFEESQFDLAIVDIFMPGMDGARIIKMLRERSPELPIVAISGVSLKASGRNALDFISLSPQLSNVVCLQKPFRTPALLEAIHQAMGVQAA